MPLFEGFRSTNVWNAFVLNSLVAAIAIVIAIVVKGSLDTYKDEKGNEVKRISSIGNILATLLITFGASMLTYTFFHFTLDYGKGMLIPDYNSTH
jgi:hypothetical protein